MDRILETRNIHTVPDLETRADAGEDFIRITGYGAVFNRKYSVMGFREQVAPGAFTKTLADNPDIRGMFNHSPDFLLGRTKSGTMDVEEDKRGLRYEIRADKQDPQAQSVARKIERGDVDGSSMAFFVHQEEWEEKGGKPQLRTIKEVELIETGPVTMPASPATTSKIQRALEETEIDFEALMGLAIKRRAGFRLEAAEDDLVAQTIKRLERLKADPESATEHSLSPAMALKYSRAAWTLRTRMAALSLA
jgi:hypothetical protein